MKITIETGTDSHISLIRSGDQIVMDCKPHGGPASVHVLTVDTLSELVIGLTTLAEQLPIEESNPDPKSPWQVGARIAFDRGMFRDRVLVIAEVTDDGSEDRYKLAGSDMGDTVVIVRKRDLDAAARVIGLNDHPAFTDQRSLTVRHRAGIQQDGTFTPIEQWAPAAVYYAGHKVDLPIFYVDMDEGQVCFYRRGSHGEMQISKDGSGVERVTRWVRDWRKLEIRTEPQN